MCSLVAPSFNVNSDYDDSSMQIGNIKRRIQLSLLRMRVSFLSIDFLFCHMVVLLGRALKQKLPRKKLFDESLLLIPTVIESCQGSANWAGGAQKRAEGKRQIIIIGNDVINNTQQQHETLLDDAIDTIGASLLYADPIVDRKKSEESAATILSVVVVFVVRRKQLLIGIVGFVIILCSL